ncbi:MAG: hypothetical protein A2103_04005 [Gammaproteobacteria bacterium GWF2_41_13]|nr:MAG: hypothetical protein A2103_04005 [Gammaproteobacteria bacterium GWF2_41_13]
MLTSIEKTNLLSSNSVAVTHLAKESFAFSDSSRGESIAPDVQRGGIFVNGDFFQTQEGSLEENVRQYFLMLGSGGEAAMSAFNHAVLDFPSHCALRSNDATTEIFQPSDFWYVNIYRQSGGKIGLSFYTLGHQAQIVSGENNLIVFIPSEVSMDCELNGSGKFVLTSLKANPLFTRLMIRKSADFSVDQGLTATIKQLFGQRINQLTEDLRLLAPRDPAIRERITALADKIDDTAGDNSLGKAVIKQWLADYNRLFMDLYRDRCIQFESFCTELSESMQQQPFELRVTAGAVLEAAMPFRQKMSVHLSEVIAKLADLSKIFAQAGLSDKERMQKANEVRLFLAQKTVEEEISKAEARFSFDPEEHPHLDVMIKKAHEELSNKNISVERLEAIAVCLNRGKSALNAQAAFDAAVEELQRIKLARILDTLIMEAEALISFTGDAKKWTAIKHLLEQEKKLFLTTQDAITVENTFNSLRWIVARPTDEIWLSPQEWGFLREQRFVEIENLLRKNRNGSFFCIQQKFSAIQFPDSLLKHKNRDQLTPVLVAAHRFITLPTGANRIEYQSAMQQLQAHGDKTVARFLSRPAGGVIGRIIVGLGQMALGLLQTLFGSNKSAKKGSERYRRGRDIILGTSPGDILQDSIEKADQRSALSLAKPAIQSKTVVSPVGSPTSSPSIDILFGVSNGSTAPHAIGSESSDRSSPISIPSLSRGNDETLSQSSRSSSRHSMDSRASLPSSAGGVNQDANAADHSAAVGAPASIIVSPSPSVSGSEGIPSAERSSSPPTSILPAGDSTDFILGQFSPMAVSSPIGDPMPVDQSFEQIGSDKSRVLSVSASTSVIPDVTLRTPLVVHAPLPVVPVAANPSVKKRTKGPFDPERERFLHGRAVDGEMSNPLTDTDLWDKFDIKFPVSPSQAAEATSRAPLDVAGIAVARRNLAILTGRRPRG